MMKNQKLVLDVCDSWIETLPLTLQQMDLLSQEFRSLPSEPAFKRFADLVDQAHMLFESLVSFQLLLSTTPLKGTLHSWPQHQEVFVKVVAETLKAFEKRDYNWLADIIEYDLAQELQSWQERLRELRERVDKMDMGRKELTSE